MLTLSRNYGKNSFIVANKNTNQRIDLKLTYFDNDKAIFQIKNSHCKNDYRLCLLIHAPISLFRSIKSEMFFKLNTVWGNKGHEIKTAVFGFECDKAVDIIRKEIEGVNYQ